MRTLTHAEWIEEGIRRFGMNMMRWSFVCPSCGHVSSVQDWLDAGAASCNAHLSCIGRYLNDPKMRKKTGGPCDYDSGGLIGLNPVEILMGNEQDSLWVFEFADA